MKALNTIKVSCVALFVFLVSPVLNNVQADGSNDYLTRKNAAWLLETTQRADAGDAFVQAVLAMHYQLGWKTQKNPQLAAKYALASARAGHPLGKFRLGVLLRAGEGVPKDEQQGLALQAASFDGLNRSNDVFSLTALGILIFQGKAVAQNVSQAARYKEAARLYKLAADAHFAPAAFNYAMCADAGHGISKNLEEKLEYLDRASIAEYPPALKYLAEQEEKFSLNYPDYHVPKIDLDICRAAINPETQVWEKASEKGRSARWATLCTSASGPLTIVVRTQYSGYPVSFNMQRLFPGEVKMNTGGDGQTTRNCAQYHIEKESDTTVEIGPTLPMEERNLWSLHEYPMILEFKVTNHSPSNINLEALQLDILQSKPITKNIFGVILDRFSEFIILHDFGWGSWLKQKVEMAAVSGTHILQPFTEIKEGFGAEQQFKKYFSDTILVRTTNMDHSGVLTEPKSSVQAFWAGDYSYSLLRIPTDATLPSNRSGYTLIYPIHRSLADGETKTFTISISSDKSAQFLVSPLFKTTLESQRAEKNLQLTIETLHPVENRPIRAIPSMQAGDRMEYQLFQMETLESLSLSTKTDNPPAKFRKFGTPYTKYDAADDLNCDFEIRREKVPDLLTDDFSQQDLKKLEQENDELAANKDMMSVRHHLKPTVFSIDKTLLLTRLDEPVICRLGTPDGITLNLTGSSGDKYIDGHLEISLTGANQPVAFRAAWSLDDAVEEMHLQYALGREANWVAWIAVTERKSRIYLVFPKYSNLTFSLPFVPEHEAKSISSSTNGDGLLIESEAGTWTYVNLSDALIRHLVVVSEAGGIVSPIKTDIDSLGRVRLWIPYVKASDSAGEATEPMTCNIHKKVSPNENISISWFSDLQLGIGNGDNWKIWNLANGTCRSATDSENTELQNSKNKIYLTKDPQGNYYSAYSMFTAAGIKYEVGKRVGDNSSYNRSLYIYRAERDMEPPILPLEITPFENGRYHSRQQVFSDGLSVSPNQKYLAVLNTQGTEVWIIDIKNLTLAARAIVSPKDTSVCTVVDSDGYYLSGDGNADGYVLSKGSAAIPISRLEVKFNRPDKVLERLGADESLIKEARRLRERLVRRSDFKSLEDAMLLDIPVVAVKSAAPEKTTDKSLTLDFEASNNTGPLKELRVFNNGALIKILALKGKDGEPSRESAGEVKVDLASGDNRLQLMVVSQEGFTSSFAEKNVDCMVKPDSRRCFIATVGISEYNDPRFNLKFAAKDADDMSKALAEEAMHRGYQPEMLVVKNTQVDSSLVPKLREFLSKAETDDEVILFFAGHGLLDKNLEYHFARHDTNFEATENIGVTFQELESLVDGIKPLKRTVLFDTCHSGEVEEEDRSQLLAMASRGDALNAETGIQVRGVATRGMKVKELEPKLRHTDFMEMESLFPDSRRAKGANILTSSSGSEFSMESDTWQNGLFTYAFLNALRDKKSDANDDRNLSFSEVATVVQDKVKTLSQGYQKPITRGINREAEVILASFNPPLAPTDIKEKESAW